MRTWAYLASGGRRLEAVTVSTEGRLLVIAVDAGRFAIDYPCGLANIGGDAYITVPGAGNEGHALRFMIERVEPVDTVMHIYLRPDWRLRMYPVLTLGE